jgi:hypothetical protein
MTCREVVVTIIVACAFIAGHCGILVLWVGDNVVESVAGLRCSCDAGEGSEVFTLSIRPSAEAQLQRFLRSLLKPTHAQSDCIAFALLQYKEANSGPG